MLRVLRSARAASAIMRPRTTPNVARAVSTTPRVLAGHPAPPAFVGGGSPAGEVPTEDTQATGLERFEILGANEGIDVFDMSPLEMTRMGTMADPIKIRTIVRFCSTWWPEIMPDHISSTPFRWASVKSVAPATQLTRTIPSGQP